MKFDTTLIRCTWSGPLGPMTLAAHDTALTGIWFDGQQHQPALEAQHAQSQPILCEAIAQLEQYFGGKRKHFDLPLDFSGGTAFQQDVWRALLNIAPGTTVSYGTISQRVGRPAAVRAVGVAVGRNPLGIVVPCHRVVGSNGALTGYAGGLDRKIALLQLESPFFDH
jgi:methylated-DNA-[protein]-cysteine S-methyltransferase